MVKVAKASSLMAQPCPKPCCLNKSTVTSPMAEPVLNAPMLSTTTQSKPRPKPCHLNTSGGASSVAEPVPNTLQPSMSTLVTQHPTPKNVALSINLVSLLPTLWMVLPVTLWTMSLMIFSLFLMYVALFGRSQILLQSHLSHIHPCQTQLGPFHIL